ncbi:hypothetical protein V8C35DRAFT_281977 [Trichoderma chlorosporum]
MKSTTAVIATVLGASLGSSQPTSIPTALKGHIRTPPNQDCPNAVQWTSPGRDYVQTLPRWFIKWTTNQVYQALFSDYEQSYTRETSGQILDVGSFFNLTLPAGSAIQSIAGMNTPILNDDNSYQLSINNSPSGNTFSVFGYGYDSFGAWALVSETPYTTPAIPGGFDILSASLDGPENATVSLIREAVQALNCDVLTGFLQTLNTLKTDDARKGDPPFQCDANCIANISPQ